MSEDAARPGEMRVKQRRKGIDNMQFIEKFLDDIMVHAQKIGGSSS